MISWQSIVIAALSIAGLGCCGVAVICALAGGRAVDPETASRTIGTAIAAGFVGLLLLAAAYGLRTL